MALDRRRKEGATGWLFVSPWVIGFTVFLAYPLVASLYYAFCDYSVMRKAVFTGLDNFQTLFSDEIFWLSLKNTLTFAIIFIPLSLVFSLSLALLLNTKVRGQAIYRTIFYLPSLVPMVATAVLFLWVFDADNGIVNHLLHQAGFTHVPAWLTDPFWTKITIIMLSLWGLGNTMIIFLASLQETPQALYEAADVDGASPWRTFFAVTVPLISPTIYFNFIMGIIGAIQVFAVPFVMFPGGGPARSGYFYTAYLYDNAFYYNNMGYASAMGWVMFVIIIALTLLGRQLTEKHVYYES